MTNDREALPALPTIDSEVDRLIGESGGNWTGDFYRFDPADLAALVRAALSARALAVGEPVARVVNAPHMHTVGPDDGGYYGIQSITDEKFPDGTLLYASPVGGGVDAQVSSCAPGWTPVTTRFPPYDEELEVLCFSESHTFGGNEHFCTLKATDFYEYDPDETDNPGTPTSKCITHWMPRPWPPSMLAASPAAPADSAAALGSSGPVHQDTSLLAAPASGSL